MRRKKTEPKPIEEPPDEFRRWWNPIRCDKALGGSIGGHDHAPKWMQSTTGKWGWSSGISTTLAWQMQCYRDEWRDSAFDHAEPGTGLNYAYFGWHKPYDPPRTSNPDILERHRAWCKAHHRPDPLANQGAEIPDYIRNANSFEDVKKAIRFLTEKMDMNKAIGWTEADTAAAEGVPV